MAGSISPRYVRLAAILLAGAVSLVALYVAVVYIGAMFARGMARALLALPDGITWLVFSLREGADWLTIAGEVAARVGAALIHPQLIVALIALELVGAGALYALKRLLADERRVNGSGETQR